MGGGGGKGGSTTVQKMEIPPEVLARYNAVNARAETVAQAPYQSYSSDPNAFVAPLTPTQMAGIQNTNYMAGAAQPYYNIGSALTAMGAQNVNPQALSVGQYYNPMTQAVVTPTLQALQQQQGVERSSLMNPQTARSFGGDRSGLVAANMARQQDLATAQAIAPIYQNAYNTAMQNAQQQQGVGLAAQQANLARLMQAGGQFGQLGAGAQQAGLAGAQAQLGAGGTEQQTQQAGLQALYNQFQQQQAFPYQITQFLSNIATGTGALSGNQTTSTTTGGGGFFSDERLKENIEKVGETNDGQNIYRYNYKGDPRTQIGLLAQEVAQDHPEAVGKRDGYLTVDYRDATNEAVRDHKADGGAEIGTSAYDISAPSAMLSGPQIGLGALQLPQMVGGAGLPISPSATNPAAAGLLAPKATGYSVGSKEAAEAQLASLKGTKPWAGGEYQDYKTKQLEDFLAGASSQGGLVSGPGAFSRGGYAEAGYVNPALAYYGPQGAKGGLGGAGPYGAQLTPAQVAAMKAPEISRPQPQKSGLAQAAETGAALTTLGKGAGGAYDWLEKKMNAYDWDKWKPQDPNFATDYEMGSGEGQVIDLLTDRSTGGLVHREHHRTEGYVNPKSGLYATPDEEGNVLGAALTAPLERHQMMQPGKMGQTPQQPSGAQQLGQAASLGNAGKKAYDFAAKKLMGDTTGAAGQAVNVGSATSTGLGAASPGLEAALAPTGGVIDLTTAVPGLTGAAEGAAGALGAGEALAGGAAAAEGAGMLGSLAAGAGAVGEGIMTALPFLAFLSDKRAKTDVEQVGELNDGQPVYRFRYKGDDKTRMGLMAQDVEQDHPEAVKGLGGMKMVDYKKATEDAVGKRRGFQQAGLVVETDENGQPIMQGPPMPDNLPAEKGDRITVVPRQEPAPVVQREPAAKPRMAEEPSRFATFADDVGDVASGLGKKIKETASGQEFWVPALAGLGSMLASRNPTLGGAIGEGLVGGTTAYTTLQKQTADQLKQRFDLAKDIFRGPVMNANQEWVWEDTRTGEMIPQGEMNRRKMSFLGATGRDIAPPPDVSQANQPQPKPTPGPTTTAKEVISQPGPKVEPRAPAQPVEQPKAEAPAVTAPTPSAAQPKAEAPTTTTQPVGEENVALMRQRALENNQLWANVDPSMNPRMLLPEAAKIDKTINTLEERARIANENAAVANQRNPDQAKVYQAQATNLQSQIDRLTKQRDDKINRANKSLDDAVQLQVRGAETRQSKDIESQYELVETMTPDGTIVVKPKSQILQGDKPVSPGAGSPSGAVADATMPANVKKLPEAALKLRDEIGKDELKMSADYKHRQVATSRVEGLLDIMSKYETGKFAEEKGNIIGKLNALGIKVSPTDTADPAKFEIFMKSAIKNVFDDLPGGKILLAEIAGLSKANANAGMQPEANAKILGDALAAIKYEDKYTLDYAKWRAANPNAYSPMDTISFNEQWLKDNNLNNFKKEVARTTGYIGQKLPSNLSEAVHGQAYYLPAMRGIYFFDKNRKDESGNPKPGWVKSDPLAGSAAQ